VKVMTGAKVIEYTLVSVDGVFSGPVLQRFLGHRDDAYLRDGLGQLLACDVMLMGRTTYKGFARIWPGSAHPWADRLNAIRTSGTTSGPRWAKCKRQDGAHLLVYGHGLLAETLLRQDLLDVLDLSIHPIVAGTGKPFLRYARPRTCGWSP
jgi:dihydrofolate reductase